MRNPLPDRPPHPSPSKWVVRFDPAGLAADEVRMLEELIAGNVGLARLALGGGALSEDAERRIAEAICEALSTDFPHVAFRVAVALRPAN